MLKWITKIIEENNDTWEKEKIKRIETEKETVREWEKLTRAAKIRKIKKLEAVHDQDDDKEIFDEKTEKEYPYHRIPVEEKFYEKENIPDIPKQTENPQNVLNAVKNIFFNSPRNAPKLQKIPGREEICPLYAPLINLPLNPSPPELEAASCEVQIDESAEISRTDGKVDLEERKIDEGNDDENMKTNVEESRESTQAGKASRDTDLSILQEDTGQHTDPVVPPRGEEVRPSLSSLVEESGSFVKRESFPQDGNIREESDLSIQGEETGRLSEPGHVTRPECCISSSNSSQISNTLLSGHAGKSETPGISGTPESGSISPEGRQDTSKAPPVTALKSKRLKNYDLTKYLTRGGGSTEGAKAIPEKVHKAKLSSSSKKSRKLPTQTCKITTFFHPKSTNIYPKIVTNPPETADPADTSDTAAVYSPSCASVEPETNSDWVGGVVSSKNCPNITPHQLHEVTNHPSHILSRDQPVTDLKKINL